MPTKDEEAIATSADDLDAGWGDDEDEAQEDEDLDAGWDVAAAAALTPEAREREWRGLTPEEREARAARVAARKERLRTKAAAKAKRRKERASLARAKQKQKQQRSQRPPKPRDSREPPGGVEASESSAPPVAHARQPAVRATARRNDPRVVAMLVAILLLAGGVAVFLWKR